VLGTEAAQVRVAERRQAIDAELQRAQMAAGLLNDLDRARAAILGGHQGGGFDASAAARSYAAAVSAYGLDVSRPEAEAAAEIRQARPGVRLALVLALDDWAGCVRGLDAAEAERLGRIAGAADDDDWRRRYREALGDVRELKRLAGEAMGRRLPAVSQIQLGRDLFIRGAQTEATALFRLARRQHPTDFWAYLDLANSLFDLNHPDPATLDEAESCACAAVALRPNSAVAHGTLGNALRVKGDRAGASECYKKAIEIDPRLAMAHNNLGDLLCDQGDLTGAAVAFNKAKELDPKAAGPYCGLGIVLYRQGDPTGSVASFKKAIEIDPHYATALNNLGRVLQAQGDPDGAAAYYKKAIEFDRKYILAHCGLGDVLYDRRDLDGAAASYRKAIEIDPKSAEAHCGLGNVLYDQGDVDGAAASYRQAVECDPKFAEAQYGLGNVLNEQGNAAGAAARYRKAIEIDPNSPEAHFKLGLLLREQGKFGEARTHFQRCLYLVAPNSPLRPRTTDQLRQCERLLALGPKLGPVLRGEQEPADDAERLELAEVCAARRRYAAAAGFSRDAFAHDPKLADDLDAGNRSAAALDAARAGCGQGEDAHDLDDKARSGWRKQALDWLRADLAVRAKQVEGSDSEERRTVAEALRSWRKDAALAGVREPADLERLPADEQEAWRRLWGDVQELLNKANEKK
jgi:tetratricopeptide (TPR) repeat protein